MKRFLIAAVVAAIMCGSTVALPVCAETEEPITETIVEEYLYTSSVSSSLTFSGTTAYCNSTVRGNSQATRIEAVQKLQKKVLWWWDDVETWNGSDNGRNLEMCNTATVTASGTYRVRIEATVYSGSNYENVYCDSTEKTK